MKRAAVMLCLTLTAGVLVGCGTSAHHPRPTRTARTSTASTASTASPVRAPQVYPAATPTTQPAITMPTPGDVNQTDATAVALAGVRATEQSDTLLDSDPNGTAHRAIAWLTPSFAATVRHAPPVASPGAQWNTWATHHAYLQVNTALGGDDHPRDTTRSALRQVIATIQPIGRDHWRGAAYTDVVFVALTRLTVGWRLSSIQVSAD